MSRRHTREHRAEFGHIEAVTTAGGTRYRARYTGPDGKRRSGPHTFPTREDAARYLVQVRAEILRGNTLAVAPTTTTLGEYLRAWLRTAATSLRPSTLDLYRRSAERWILPEVGRIELGALPLSSLTVSLVREWHTDLVAATHAAALAAPTCGRRVHPARAWARANGYTVADSGALPAAVVDAWTAAGSPVPAPPETHAPNPDAGRTAAAQAYRLLRTVCAQAVRDGLIATNPVQVKGAATAPHPECRPLTAGEVRTLSQAVGARYAAAVLVAAWSGLRPGEVFALRRKDVDAAAGTVTVARTLLNRNGPAEFGPPKTAAGLRTVALPRRIADALAEHLDAYTDPDPDALVFTTERGRPLTNTRRSRVLAGARAQIGRPDITWHHLRHTGATLAAQAGATQAELQRRIGHASTRAAALYQHASSERDLWLADRLDALTDPAPAPSPTVLPPTPLPTAGHPAPTLTTWAQVRDYLAESIADVPMTPALAGHAREALRALVYAAGLDGTTPADTDCATLAAVLDTAEDADQWHRLRSGLEALCRRVHRAAGMAADPSETLPSLPPASLTRREPAASEDYATRRVGHLTLISATA
ncbi:tyrosine-type recombinase/integrase [Micrococcus sp. FDAARGOS_333]|uniref:tyrosine-type recombinase/integrase n=1 Tax=Micrococcus sp. FDAARGOS_333 TaxID=1930558 RepID=UPI000B4E7BCB|nr:tyrosine-type recombinase/integrase [Micrococcus sp. FDAARGOS_333]PNL17883.1 site-specific integrase [Micrococcus sp. FDAARGOS_333]